jgi:hypothetical protein
MKTSSKILTVLTLLGSLAATAQDPQQAAPPVARPQIFKMNPLNTEQVAASTNVNLFENVGPDTRIYEYNSASIHSGKLAAVFPANFQSQAMNVVIKFAGFRSFGLGAFLNVQVISFVEDRNDSSLKSGREINYTGNLILKSCNVSGRPMFRTYTSLADIFNDDINIPESSITSCRFEGSKMVSDWRTPDLPVPYATWEKPVLEFNGDTARLTVAKPGIENRDGKTYTATTPWLFLAGPRLANPYYVETLNAPNAEAEADKILNIYEQALKIIRSEQGDRNLPKTVMYLTSQRGEIAKSLKNIEHSVNVKGTAPQSILSMIVSFRMAVHKLDQALGLASGDKQLSIGQFIQQ